MRNPLIIFFTLVLLTKVTLAQDPQFSQFYANPLYMNPAFAGSTGNTRIVASARNQYTALNKNFNTQMVSVDMSISQIGGGLGLMATNDVAGDGNLSSVSYSGIYSYQFHVNKQLIIRTGIQGTYVQRSYDFSLLRFGDQIDPRYGFVYPTKEAVGFQKIGYANFGAGFLAYTDIFFGGFSIQNIAEPNISFYSATQSSSSSQYTLPRRYTAHAGLNIFLTHQRDDQERLLISPNVIYMQQRDFTQLNLGFYVKKQALTGGLWFRQTSQNSDAAIVLIGLKFPKFRAGYSYDITVSGARTATMGSHEISLAYEIAYPRQQKRIFKPLMCPVF